MLSCGSKNIKFIRRFTNLMELEKAVGFIHLFAEMHTYFSLFNSMNTSDLVTVPV